MRRERGWVGVARRRDGRIANDRAAMAVARHGELARHILAEQRDVGRVDAVRHRERAAQVAGGLCKAHVLDLDPATAFKLRASSFQIEPGYVVAHSATRSALRLVAYIQTEGNSGRAGDLANPGM
jgi:hypothetical protein